MKSVIVQYDADHPERAYAGKFLMQPGRKHLNPHAIGGLPWYFRTARNAERAAIAHGMSNYTIRILPAFNRLQWRGVWHIGEDNAVSYATETEGYNVLGRQPDAHGLYELKADGTLEFILETPY